MSSLVGARARWPPSIDSALETAADVAPYALVLVKARLIFTGCMRWHSRFRASTGRGKLLLLVFSKKEISHLIVYIAE
ncbi:hypothetical protein C1M53_07500 [Mesorhizobium sp. Pch-S]|nr:hypothetical protein C1M53_07500 [Mesorhizobium sp. Pch-S]